MMPTYAQYQAQADLKANRAAQDTVQRERHRQFDLQAQDKTAKFERHHFAVVGEGSHSSQEAFRRNYDRIFTCRSGARGVAPSSGPARPGVGAAG